MTYEAIPPFSWHPPDERVARISAPGSRPGCGYKAGCSTPERDERGAEAPRRRPANQPKANERKV
jgi:hypothetical protein